MPLDDPRLLPKKIEIKIALDMLDGKITPAEATKLRNDLCIKHYGPVPFKEKRHRKPKPSGIPCPHCKKGIIRRGNMEEGCSSCGGTGFERTGTLQ